MERLREETAKRPLQYPGSESINVCLLFGGFNVFLPRIIVINETWIE